MSIAAALLSLLIGLTLGLLGGGGSILTLPMLLYVLQMEAKASIASSLFVVGATALTGVLAHARAGTVRWRTGLVFGVAGMAGAYLGGRVAQFLPGRVLLVGFGLVMLATALAMLRGRRETGTGAPVVHVAGVLAIGLAVGAVSGLVGAGGGFLIVPALNLFGGLAMPAAVGTSLLVITLQSFAGLGGHVAHTTLDWPLLAMVAGLAVAGSFVGARIGRRLRPATLRKAFAWFVLAMALVFLGAELPRDLALGIGLGLAALGLLLLARRRSARAASQLPPTS